MVRQTVDAVTVSSPVDGTRVPTRRELRPRSTPRSSPVAETQMHPGILEAAWFLRREGEVMRALGPNVILLAHPGSAAYMEASTTSEEQG